MTPIAPGGQLGRYRLLAEVGRGGMGSVYRAHDLELDRTVAVKVLSPFLASDPGFVERFRREARTAAGLRHPNIVVVHDWGNQDGVPYLVMEFLEGQSLKAAVEQHGRLPLPIVQSIVRQCAAALDYAHGHGVVHRDVKPGNVMVDPSGHSTLTDFGIARAARGGQLTSTGGILGTPEYLSPEQALGRPVDGRSDVYSLGVMLYELLAGRVPFTADSTPAVLHLQAYAPPPPLEGVRPDLQRGLFPVVARALAKEPDGRYRTAGDLATALDAALWAATPVPSMGRAPEAAGRPLDSAPVGIGPAPAAGRPSMVQSGPSPPAAGVGSERAAALEQGGPSKAAVAGVGIVAVAIIAASVYFFWPEPGARPTPTATNVVVGGQTPSVIPPTATAPPRATQAATATVGLTSTTVPTADPSLALIREGDALFGQDPRAAGEKYRQATSRFPGSAEAWRKLGMATFFAGESHDDVKQLEEATRLNLRDAVAWAYLSCAYWSLNQYEKSGLAATRAAQVDARATETHAAIVLQHLNQLDLKSAWGEIEPALQADPSSELLQWAHIQLLASDSMYERALAAARKVIQQRPNWAAFRVIEGDLLRLQQKPAEARQAYERALQMNPRILSAHSGIGWLLLNDGKYDEARQTFETATERDELDDRAWSGLGWVAYHQKDWEAALKHFRHALDVDPKEIDAYAGTGWVLTDGLQKHAEAEASFRKALEIYPKDPGSHFGIGVTQYRRQQWDAALASFRTAVDFGPDNAYNHLWVGIAYMELRRYPDARQWMEKADVLKPNDENIKGWLAELKRRSG